MNRISINDEEEEDHQQQQFPKPPSPEPMNRENYVAEVLADVDDDIASTDPPPPYPNSSLRGSRRSRGTLRSLRRTNYQTVTVSQQPPSGMGQAETSPVVETIPSGDSETSALLPVSTNDNRRGRATSHSSTTHSIHSIGHGVISLFQTDPDPAGVETHTNRYASFLTQIQRYFRPLVKRAYYSAVFHLLFINFPYELAAWIYLFVGTLVSS